MAEITDRQAPPDVPTTDTLRDMQDPELDEDGTSIDRYLAFGTTPRAMPRPPKRGEVIVYQIKVECVGESWKERSDGEIRYSSDLHILSAARIGEELPPDFKSKKREEAEAKAAAKAAAKGQGLYDENQLTLVPDPEAEAEAAEHAAEQAAERDEQRDEYDQDAEDPS